MTWKKTGKAKHKVGCGGGAAEQEVCLFEVDRGFSFEV